MKSQHPTRLDHAAAEAELARLELERLENYLSRKYPELFLALVADCRGHEWWKRDDGDDGDEYVLNRAERLACAAIKRLRRFKLAELRLAGVKIPSPKGKPK